MQQRSGIPVALISCFGAVVVALLGSGGFLTNALQAKANDKDRQIAVLTAERDQLISMLLAARRSGFHRSRSSMRSREGPSVAEEPTAQEAMVDRVEVEAEIAAAVRPDTFEAQRTFLGTRPQRRVRVPMVK